MTSFIQNFIYVFLLISTSLAQAAIITKINKKQALIYLEGVMARKGSFFEVVNNYGEKKALIEILKVGKSKAIGIVKLGHAKQSWILKPIGYKKAMAQMQYYENKKLARKGRASPNRYDRYDQKPTKPMRFIASQETQQEVEDGLRNNYFEPGQNSSHTVSQNQRASQNQRFENNNHAYSRINSNSNKRPLFLGIMPRFELGLMHVSPNPQIKETGYLMKGLGYSLFLSLDLSLNSHIRTEHGLGVRQFFVESKSNECGSREHCSLKVIYAALSSNIKWNIINRMSHRLWIAAEGLLMYPVDYKNETNISDNSFQGPHGTIGGAFGLDLIVDKLIFPLALRFGFHMPPTQVKTGVISAQMGLSYEL